jgi:hypothetical protein
VTGLYDFYRAEVLVWAGTDRALLRIDEGSRMRKVSNLRASDRTIRAFIRAAYKRHSVPVRINWVRRLYE